MPIRDYGGDSPRSRAAYSKEAAVPRFTDLPRPSRTVALLVATAALVVAFSPAQTFAASAVLSVPGQASPGATITVGGNGFASSQTGYLTYNGGRVTTFTASSGGSFSVPFKVPASAAIGTGRISARDGAGVLLATATLQIVAVAPPPPASGFPIRAAFYYGWFPEAWDQSGMNPYTHYHPSAGWYSESDASTIARQIHDMQYGKISAGIASWWGQGSRTDQRMPLLLSTASGTGFRWSIYYEPEGYSNPSSTQIASDIAYIVSHYGSNSSFLHINGKPVIFVWSEASDGCAMATRWKQANASGSAYIVLKVFQGFATCSNQPDQWHQYGPAVAASDQKGHSYSIGPGFWLATSSTPVLARNISRWQQNVRDMVASGEPFQLITTFNEWGEGTAIESAQEWATASGYGAYLDALHYDGVMP